MNLLSNAFGIHEKALGLRSQRLELIAKNIANADTPGYQARDFDFGAALRAARAGRDGSGLAEGIARGVMNPGGRAAPAMQYLHPAQTNLDGNSVDMNRERASFMDNALKFDATLRFINGNVRTTLDAMKSPNSP
jgi:flagellar basal-body rod protein FlgB